MDDLQKSILRHISGATVTHAGPYKNLPVPVCDRELTQDERNEWVAPFYMSIDSANQTPFVVKLWERITQKQIIFLLSQFGWRERTAAVRLAYLAAIEGIETTVGNLLLRSDFCFVGSDYCLLLAHYNTRQSIAFLREYLDYYLGQKALHFDQGAAMAALVWLDELNQTRVHQEYLDAWHRFIADKPGWNLQQSVDGFRRSADSMNRWQSSLHDRLA